MTSRDDPGLFADGLLDEQPYSEWPDLALLGVEGNPDADAEMKKRGLI